MFPAGGRRHDQPVFIKFAVGKQVPFVPVVPWPPDGSLSAGCRAESGVRPLTCLCAHKARGRHQPPPRGEANLPHRGGPRPICFLVPAACFPAACPPVLGGSEALWEPEGTAARLPSRESAASATSAGQPRGRLCCRDGAVWAGSLPLQPPPSFRASVPGYPCPPKKRASVPASLRALWLCFPAG